jgi:hypothetical protein
MANSKRAHGENDRESVVAIETRYSRAARFPITLAGLAGEWLSFAEGLRSGYWDEVWLEDGAVYFVQGSWVDAYGDVFDPDGRTWYATHGVEPFAPGWYLWQD